MHCHLCERFCRLIIVSIFLNENALRIRLLPCPCWKFISHNIYNIFLLVLADFLPVMLHIFRKPRKQTDLCRSLHISKHTLQQLKLLNTLTICQLFRYEFNHLLFLFRQANLIILFVFHKKLIIRA